MHLPSCRILDLPEASFLVENNDKVKRNKKEKQKNISIFNYNILLYKLLKLIIEGSLEV